LEGVAKADQRARERALYVEMAPTGSAMRPAGVSEAEATSWVSAMVALFATLGKVWADALDDALALANDSGSVT
jgi:hypothetical protein